MAYPRFPLKQKREKIGKQFRDCKNNKTKLAEQLQLDLKKKKKKKKGWERKVIF